LNKGHDIVFIYELIKLIILFYTLLRRSLSRIVFFLIKKSFMSEEKKLTIANATELCAWSEITNHQLCHFFRADISLGMAIAQGPGINPGKRCANSMHQKKQQRYNTKKDR